MGTYTAKTRNVGRRPRSKRLRELGGSVTINNGSAPDLDGYELLSNKVAEVDSESTDEQYPTAKCLYDALADIATAIEGLSSVFSAIGHVHAIADITGLQAALDGKAAADHTHSQYLTAHQTVTNKAATIGTSLTTIATIGGTDITAKIDTAAQTSHTHAISDITNLQTTLDGKAAADHTHGEIARYNEALSGNNIDYNAVSYYRDTFFTIQPIHAPNYSGQTNIPFLNYGQMLTLGGRNSFFPFRLAFGHNNAELYIQYGGYKTGQTFNFSGCSWRRVLNHTNFSDYALPLTGGTISDTAITTAKTVLDVVAGVSSPTSSIAVYGMKVTLSAGTGTPPDNTNSAAIYAVGSFGYAGLFSGSVKVSSSLTANSVSAATVYQTSDDRLKDYVGEFHFALADLERIPLRLFRFKADKEGKVLIGTSAQAVQKVLPEIVGKSRTASEDDTEEYLNVDYSKLALVALDCVRQLRDEVAALRREIDELKRGR